MRRDDRPTALAAAAAAAVILATCAVGCGGGASRSVMQTTTTVRRTRPGVPARPLVSRTTTTTVWRPSSPQASPDSAAALLMQYWSDGDPRAARAVAAPAAVATLFAFSYPVGNLQARGCTTGANPATCTYRNTITGGIYEVAVSHGRSGWYVSSVVPED